MEKQQHFEEFVRRCMFPFIGRRRVILSVATIAAAAQRSAEIHTEYNLFFFQLLIFLLVKRETHSAARSSHQLLALSLILFRPKMTFSFLFPLVSLFSAQSTYSANIGTQRSDAQKPELRQKLFPECKIKEWTRKGNQVSELFLRSLAKKRRNDSQSTNYLHASVTFSAPESDMRSFEQHWHWRWHKPARAFALIYGRHRKRTKAKPEIGKRTLHKLNCRKRKEGKKSLIRIRSA